VPVAAGAPMEAGVVNAGGGGGGAGGVDGLNMTFLQPDDSEAWIAGLFDMNWEVY
jgi:hypothetical protein